MAEPNTQIESLLRQHAADFPYPPTPDLAAGFPRPARRPVPRPLAWAAVLLLVAILSLLAVPATRARLAEFLQIGGLQIAPIEATNELPQNIRDDLLALDGQATLEGARAQLDFALSYPAELGEPDLVYVQDIGTGDFAILVWLAHGEVDAALYVLGPDVSLTKLSPEPLQVVTVNGQPGALIAGERVLTNQQGLYNPFIFVEAPALVWESLAGITYRLEADLPLDDLLRIAESIPE